MQQQINVLSVEVKSLQLIKHKHQVLKLCWLTVYVHLNIYTQTKNKSQMKERMYLEHLQLLNKYPQDILFVFMQLITSGCSVTQWIFCPTCSCRWLVQRSSLTRRTKVIVFLLALMNSNELVFHIKAWQHSDYQGRVK